MSNITNTLIANITATEDTTQNVIVNRTVPNLNFDSNTAEGVIYGILANGANAITLPAAKCFQLYIRNNDPANTITPTITPTGGAPAALPILFPGDAMFIWQSNTSSAAGFTALSLSANAANTLVEYFIGA